LYRETMKNFKLTATMPAYFSGSGRGSQLQAFPV
jgi:hypothetical protein